MAGQAMGAPGITHYIFASGIQRTFIITETGGRRKFPFIITFHNFGAAFRGKPDLSIDH